MTSITASNFAYTGFADRSPRISFGARLAALRARYEQTPILSAASGVVVGAALALVPFVGLAFVFVTV